MKSLLRFILKYYYCLTDIKTPSKYKKIILGSLIYFIFPIDLIPDLVGVVGYSDDLIVMIVALLSLKKYCTDEHKIKADNFLEKRRGK